jgi:hypothetical protein
MHAKFHPLMVGRYFRLAGREISRADCLDIRTALQDRLEQSGVERARLGIRR